MAKNLYRILEASEHASPETLSLLFEQKLARLQKELDAGNPSAKEHMWAVKTAYETLSDPEQRAQHDRLLNAASSPPPPRRSQVEVKEGPSWKTSAMLLILLAAGLVGFGLQMGRANKKDDTAVRMIEVVKTTDNDATRANTERVFVDGTLRNNEKTIDNQAQIAHRAVAVEESAESRKSRALEYQANAGTELLRQQEERTKIANEQLKWERKQYEQDMAQRQSQERTATSRMQSIQIMIADGRLGEARAYANTPQEIAAVSSAEQARAYSQRKTRH